MSLFQNRKLVNKVMYILAIVIAGTTILMLFGAAFINK